MTKLSNDLVSIVMPSFNQAEFIEASLDSVLGQSYRHTELIVADGGSTDGTLDILKSRRAEDSRLRWFSEPDEGPADALNKAFKQARGTYLGWLNSDDLYPEGSIERAMGAFTARPDWLLAYGQGQHIDETGQIINTYPTKKPDTPVEEFRNGCFICQPSMFMKRTAWVLLGDLDLSLKTAFDFDYWVRAFLKFQGRIGFIDEVQAFSRLHSDCITMKMRRYVAVEGMRLLATHLEHAPGHWLLTYINEMLRTPPEEREFDNLRQHVSATLEEVREYMLPDEYASLSRTIAQIEALDRYNARVPC